MAEASPVSTPSSVPSLAADVIIVGAGVTGCATAAALADGRRRILVLESRSADKPRPRFAGELIHPTGTQVLADLGFLPELRRHGGMDIDGFAVVKPGHGTATRLPYAEIPRTRSTGWAMEHNDLVTAMREHLRRLPGVELRFGHKVEELLRDGHKPHQGRICGVRCSNGNGASLLGARLVLGCDGRHSKIRPLLGLAEQARLLSFSVAFRLPGGARLLPHPTYGHIFLGAWGPMLLYPIGWSMDSSKGEGGSPNREADARGCFDVTSDLSGGPRGAAERLRRDYAPHLPPHLAQAMLQALDREPPQIAANESIRTDRAVLPGAAIVGDAGGCSHPLTATGMTVGFTDAQRLGRLLAPLGCLEDAAAVDLALRRYEVERYRFVRAREVLADALYEVFRASEPGTRAIREGIFRYWEGSTEARARSMALLSGADSRLGVFLREYLTVVGTAGSAALSARGERADSLAGLWRKSVEKFSIVLRDVQQETLRVALPGRF